MYRSGGPSDRLRKSRRLRFATDGPSSEELSKSSDDLSEAPASAIATTAGAGLFRIFALARNPLDLNKTVGGLAASPASGAAGAAGDVESMTLSVPSDDEYLDGPMSWWYYLFQKAMKRQVFWQKQRL